MTQRYKGNGGAKSLPGMSAPVTRDLTPFPPKPETIQQLLSAGEDLARLMESPVLNLAWGWTIQALTEEWVESRPEDKAKKDDLHRMLQVAGLLKQTMTHYIELAKVQHQNMAQQEQLRQQAIAAGVPPEEL